MRRVHLRAATAVVALLFAAWRPAVTPLSLDGKSQLWIDGKSTVRAFTCRATAIEGAIDGDGAAAIAGVLRGEKVVRTAQLTFPAAKLDCANGTMNGHMLRALNAAQHPAITFALGDYELAATDSVTGTLQGTLTLNGVSLPITLPARFAASAGALRVTGSYALKMTEWKVTPPRLMMGALKVNEMVTVNFDLLLNP